MKSMKLRHVHLYLIYGFHFVLALCTASVSAGELHLAVAANFTQPLKQHLKQQFEKDSGHRLIISFGGTGQLYSQIKFGAPFDLFLAADMKRPEKLVSEGLAVAGSLFTYAEGQLILWSPDPDIVDANGKILSTGQFKHLAIAHPKMAPYGAAAKQVLEKLGLWKTLQRQRQIVRGNNVSQAYQFTATGNAQLGFIALSQYQATPKRGSHWQVPKDWYSPIRQGAVLLKRGQNNPAAKAFIAFLQSDSARQTIEELGYVVPLRREASRLYETRESLI
ncbi:MAG: molybdate ABC transporter substrate-binding protein [Candidatus Parabeggiatoa sp.]|nr:molybdate ABC transporter substrate-binding protein [Candidatus Parabeggiatoa sp.]